MAYMKMKKTEVSWHTLAFMCRLTETLRPKVELTISQWAEENMVFSVGTNEPGQYTTDTAPYQKQIMDAIVDPEVTEVTVMSSAQIGKTTIEMCGIGFYICHEPAMQMIVMPTVDDSQKFSKTKLAPMIADVKALRERVSKAKTRDSSNTLLLKSYPGGNLVISGANSPPSLSMLSVRIVWMDEIDRFPESAGSEGNPIRLAEKRATSYWNKKYIKLSTPTIAGKSNIEEEYGKGSMEQWCVKCPECGKFQPYSFDRLEFASVSMACEHCGCLFPEQKWKESEHGWIAEHPERKKRRSFRINEMASPLVEWQEIIDAFRYAYKRMTEKHDPRDMITFVNTRLGETWDETKMDADVIDKNDIEKRAEFYGADIPEGVLMLTAAVDVQKDWLEVEVRGWARNYETWGIFREKFYGDLVMDEPWHRVEAYLDQTFEFSDGRRLGIAGFAVDTGGCHTNKVYKWTKAQKKRGKKCYAIKGYAGKPDIPLIYNKRIVDIKEEINRKVVVIDKTVLQIVGVDSGKEDITNRLKITEPGEGYCHFPADEGRGYDHDYYEGLTSEHKIEKNVRGIIKTAWVKKSGARNEPFDLFNYNYVAVELIKPNWDVLEEKLRRGINYMEPGAGTKKRTRRTIDGIEVYG